MRLVIERDGKRIERQVVPAAIDRFETGAIGVLPVMHPQIAEVRSRTARRTRPDCAPATSCMAAGRRGAIVVARAADRTDPGATKESR